MEYNWISVDERLPEICRDQSHGCSKYVLTRDRFGDIISAWYQYECAYQKNRENIDSGYKVGWHGTHVADTCDPLVDITHWIEMDALPKIPEAKCEQ